MAAETNVNTNQMRSDADNFSRISTVATQIASYLQNAITNLGPFWGNDKVGAEFINQFRPGFQGLIDTGNGIGKGTDAISNSVKNSADIFDNSNKVNGELAG